ncbi:hypothetical protein [Haladaptatus cibarius]|uniref:hypothetical protein n=1 Tax=Haladaptatus cibarius TaxID=453847 RepID=UPI000A815018|nr:hypothetical protein [Haladaptatus cibarius]
MDFCGRITTTYTPAALPAVPLAIEISEKSRSPPLLTDSLTRWRSFAHPSRGRPDGRLRAPYGFLGFRNRHKPSWRVRRQA